MFQSIIFNKINSQVGLRLHSSLSIMTARKWVVNNKISGIPKLDDFSCKSEEIPKCGQGDIVLKAEFLSVDPYMRYRLALAKVGDTPPGSQVAKIIESQNDSFAVGSHVVAYPGWRDLTHMTKSQLKDVDMFPVMPIPDISPLPRSLALGVLGMPGNTAYFGLLELCRPKEGETVVVNGAAGAVGSLVVQIAKIKGCRVIAFAGSAEKVAWVKSLGADYVYNYKTQSISDSLKESAPDGVNCYFDNVGGSFTAQVVPHMALFGRVALCGLISGYNDTKVESEKKKSPWDEKVILVNQLCIEGFIVTRWLSRWMEGVNQMAQWIKQGKIKYQETITDGFEKTPNAFIGLFSGENTGKAIIKV